MMARVMKRIALACVTLAILASSGSLRAGTDPDNPDWPCIQRKVPEISTGMVWAGPPVSEDGRSWQDDKTLVQLVQELAARRLPLGEAYAGIDRYAESLTGDRDQALTLLFAGLHETINRERSEIMEGIERYARKQKQFAESIQTLISELNGLLNKEGLTDEEQERRQQVEEQLVWESRIFEEREQSLTYVCESPVILEQRLFALARHLMGHLSE